MHHDGALVEGYGSPAADSFTQRRVKVVLRLQLIFLICFPIRWVEVSALTLKHCDPHISIQVIAIEDCPLVLIRLMMSSGQIQVHLERDFFPIEHLPPR